jgi:predicted transcriptional regulator
MTIRLSTLVKDKLAELAQHTRRSKSFLASDAIAGYVGAPSQSCIWSTTITIGRRAHGLRVANSGWGIAFSDRYRRQIVERLSRIPIVNRPALWSSSRQ